MLIRGRLNSKLSTISAASYLYSQTLASQPHEYTFQRGNISYETERSGIQFKMEPTDASRIDNDQVRSSRRRISSILKTPQTSDKLIGAEQEERQVKIAKPVDKRRNSKRVSFAPSNDVLLFSKEMKNGSPICSPLQDLTSTTAENLDNRAHMGTMEDGTQPITGMETLLNAPLHVLQHRNKENIMFNHDAQNDYGETTVMFSGEDSAFMDVTHCHTILIAHDSESPIILTDKSNADMQTCGDMDFTFPMDNTNTGCFEDAKESCAPFKNAPTSARNIDPEFENFLASLSKSSGSKANLMTPKSSARVVLNSDAPPPEKVDTKGLFARLNARKSGVDKENQPLAMPTMRRDCPVGSVTTQGLHCMNTSLMPTEQDNMDLTKSLTSSIDSKGVFQSVQTARSDQPRLGGSAFSQSSFNADPDDMEITRSQTVAIDSKTIGMEKPSLNKTKFDLRLPHVPPSTKYSMFSEDVYSVHQGLGTGNSVSEAIPDLDNMEITRSQTVAIDTKSLSIVNPIQNSRRKSVSFMSAYNRASHISEESECGMDMTKALTVSIDHRLGPKMTENKVFPTSNHQTGKFKESLDRGESSLVMDDMEITRSQTVAIDSKTIGMEKPSLNKTKFDLRLSHAPPSTKYSMFSEDVYSVQPGLGTGNSVSEAIPDPDNMEITRSQTVAIDTKSLSIVNPIQNSRRKSVSMSAYNRASHISEDVYSVHQGLGTGNSVSEAIPDPDNSMEITRSQTVVIDSRNLGTVTPSVRVGHGKNSIMLDSNETLILSGDGNGLEMTQALTAPIVEIVSHPAHVELTSQFGAEALRGIKAPISSGSDDIELTKSHTVAIESKHIDAMNAKCPSSSSGVSLLKRDCPLARFIPQTSKHDILEAVPPNLEDMEMTRDQTVFTETSCSPVKPWCSISDEDHEMEMTKAVTTQMELLDAPNMGANTEASLSDVPDGQMTEITANFPDPFPQKGLGKLNSEPQKEHCLIPDKPDSFPITNTASIDQLSPKKAKTRRMSLADLQSKLQRMVSESTVVMSGCTAPLSQFARTSDKHTVETESLTVVDYGCTTVGLIADKPDETKLEDQIAQDEKPNVTAPLNMKTKRLTSRLSFGGFLPKLPQRTKPLEPNQSESSHKSNFAKLLKRDSMGVTKLRSCALMDNINDEEFPDISSEEDLSETVDTKSPQRIDDEGSPSQMKLSFDEEEGEEGDEVCEEPIQILTQGQKRPLPEEDHEDSMEDEKRRKPSIANIQEMGPPTVMVQWENNGTGSAYENTLSAMTKITDGSSSNSTNLRCEATFESTYEQSQFQSQLEDTGDYTFDVRKKLQDGSITVTEFLKLFSIDFVIHKPRQSILPSKSASDLVRQTKELLTEKHINRPKQRVYETECQKLTEMVEGLKAGMKDQNSSLKSINGTLWEAVKSFSDEELLLFGTKLKERRIFFRKRSKVRSHEMKAALYSQLVHTTKEAQTNLRGKIKKADEMLKDIDECLHDLEAELVAIEGTGVEDCEPSLKSRQHGLETVGKAMAENERQMCELEIQKTHSVDKLDKLHKETRKLEKHIALLDRVNEWKFGEKDDNRTIYSFLYESLQLEVLFETPDGEACKETEVNIVDVTFHLQLDDEVSQCYSCLVHKLLSQYIDSQSTWVKKYPTSRYVPKLLHDVGLVVSRCRLLGEEIHLLKKWGALRLDILEISCVDTQVRILFSSLKAFVKFEITIAVTSAYPFCLLHVQNFQNHIGNTTIHQLEEIIFSVTPAKNYLTKIVKRIHDTLLC